VLTQSGDLPAQHPLWEDWTSVRVWTAPARVASLRRQLPSHVAVVPATGEGVSSAVEALAAEGLGRISLELGPGAMRPLYRQGAVDSLWACRFLGPELSARARGDAWPFVPDDLERWRVAQGASVMEPSGRWCFARHLVR